MTHQTVPVPSGSHGRALIGKRLHFVLVVMACAAFAPTFLPAQVSIDVLRYTAAISFDITARTLDAQATVEVRNPGPSLIDTIRLHLRDLTVTSVTIAGSPANHAQRSGVLHIHLPAALSAGDSTAITVSYNGTATSEAGPSSWGGCFWGSTTFAMGVGFHAPYVSMTRHWLPSNDIPSDKAAFDLTFIVPDGYVAAGIGLLYSASSQNGKTAWRWIETHPTASYLATYAISAYARVLDTDGRYPYEYYVARPDSNRARQHFSTVPGMVAAFEQAYGPYPFDKIGYCLTPIGSMEHQTMVSYAASLFRDTFADGIAAHELAHQWWGDCVTPSDFSDAWLSEGFATYSEAIYRESTGGRSAYLQRARQFITEYFIDEQYEGTFPLHGFPRTPPSSNYPGTIYTKGAAVLTMLRHVMGDSAFFLGLRTYRGRHEYGNAGSRDLQLAMESALGKPLGWFFDEWVFKSGYPRYTVSSPVPRTGQPFRLWIEQNTNDTSRYPLFAMPIDIWIVTNGGDTLRYVIESGPMAKELFTFQNIADTAVSRWLFDPLGIVLKTTRTDVLDIDGAVGPDDEVLRIGPGYPNPSGATAGGHTTIPFDLRTPSFVRAVLYDSLGQRVADIAEAFYGPGRHSLSVPVAGLAPGLYLVQISAGASSAVVTIVTGR